MSRHPGERGPIRTAVRVFPPGRTDTVEAFVAGTLGETHPCGSDAARLATSLAGATRTGAAVVVSYASRWAYVIIRPVGRTGMPGPPTALGAPAAADVIARLEQRAVRWGMTREARRSAIWFELDAATEHPTDGGHRLTHRRAS